MKNDIPIILITTKDNKDKREEVAKELDKVNLKITYTVEMVRDVNHAAGVAEGHLTALSIFNPPFIILEDDVRIRNDNFDFQTNSDCVYLGLSTWGLDNLMPKDNHISYKPIDNNTIRIYNMLSTHSILYKSKSFIKMVKRICEYSISNLVPFDVELAKVQKYFNVIGLSDPLFYQSGYNEYCTNVNLRRVLN
jgi:hypothetical protein